MTIGASCGAQFSTAETALLIPDITVNWAGNRVVTCDGQAMWLKFMVPQDRIGQKLYITAGTLHPDSNTDDAGRFADVRVDAALFGPGLSPVDTGAISDSNPAVVVPSNLASSGALFLAADDLSVCDSSMFLAKQVPPLATETDGLCTYFEPLGQTYKAVVLDQVQTIAQMGLHYVSFWTRTGSTAKIWISVGLVNGNDDFATKFVMPQGTCNCGSQGLLDTNFFEKDTLPFEPEPAELQCGDAPDLADYCPPSDDVTPPPAIVDPNGGPASFYYNWVMGCGQVDSCPVDRSLMAAVSRMQSSMAVSFMCDPNLDVVHALTAQFQGELDLCAVVLAHANAEAGLVHFCQRVMERDRAQLAVLNQWLVSTSKTPGLPCPPGQLACGQMTCPSSQALASIYVNARSGMAISYSCNVNADFAHLMIPNHQAALDICQVATSSGGVDAALLSLCQSMNIVQPGEVMYLFEWVKAYGLKTDVRCDNSRNFYPVQEPCADMLPILPVCMQLGGDGKCSCSALTRTAPCGSSYQGLNITQVCTSSCLACPAPAAPFPTVGLGGYRGPLRGSSSGAQGLRSAAALLLALAAALLAR